MTMRRRDFLKRLDAAHAKVSAEIENHAAGGSMYARGTASEGYAGGYRQALQDVKLMLTSGIKTNRTRYWE